MQSTPHLAIPLQLPMEQYRMQPVQQIVIAIRGDMDIVKARSAARDVARNIGFGPIDQARIATAVSELARYVLLHSGEGHVAFQNITRTGRNGIEFEVLDNGPRPATSEQELFLSQSFAPLPVMENGLQGAQRLMDEFVVETQTNDQTRITCRKWRL
jgi:serine/threonine-protein kinase RsbT